MGIIRYVPVHHCLIHATSSQYRLQQAMGKLVVEIKEENERREKAQEHVSTQNVVTTFTLVRVAVVWNTSRWKIDSDTNFRPEANIDSGARDDKVLAIHRSQESDQHVVAS